MPGALSAVGILLADAVRDYSRTVMLPGDAIEKLERHFAELEERGVREFAAEGLQGVAQRTVDLRYRGQGYELNVPCDTQLSAQAFEAFHRLHQQRYGFCDPARASGDREPAPAHDRGRRAVCTRTTANLHPVTARRLATRERPMSSSMAIHATRHLSPRTLMPGDVIHGPAMITEYTSATVLPPGCRRTSTASETSSIACRGGHA